MPGRAEGGSGIRRLPKVLRRRSGDHSRLVSSGALLDPREFVGHDDEIGQCRLRLYVVAGGVRLVAFAVDAQRGAGGAGAGREEERGGGREGVRKGGSRWGP